MGTIKGNQYSNMNGKVGNLIHYTLGNKQIVRIVGEIHKPASINQLACRQEMKVVVDFLNPIVTFINAGFLWMAQQADKRAHNMAVSYNKKYALQGNYPEITIDYTKVLVAQGDLRRAEAAQAELVVNGVQFSWNTGLLDMKEGRQRVMMVAYFPVLQLAVYMIDGANRAEGIDVLLLNAILQNQYMETYLSFISTPGNNVADSVYTGSLNAGH